MRIEGFATGGYHVADIGGGFGAAGGTVTINGCSVKAETIKDDPTNGANAAGFFTIGVSESPGVQPSDGYRRLPIIVPPVLPQ